MITYPNPNLNIYLSTQYTIMTIPITTDKYAYFTKCGVYKVPFIISP